MGYQKFLVDNVTCSRRFHITYDPDAPTVAKTEAKCPYCNLVVFTAENHAPVRLARQENLVQTAQLSDSIMRKCDFEDTFSAKTVPGQPSHKPMYPKQTTDNQT